MGKRRQDPEEAFAAQFNKEVREKTFEALLDAIAYAVENNLDEIRLPLAIADELCILASLAPRKGLGQRGIQKPPEYKLNLQEQWEQWSQLRDELKAKGIPDAAGEAYNELWDQGKMSVGFRHLQRFRKKV
jgi:hypothetical protein